MNPINILLGENSVETDKYFADLLDQHLKDEKLIELRKRLVGLVETCPFRGVPAIPEEMRKGNPLRVYARDPFSLPFDKDAIKGPLPNLKYAIPQGDFEFRKKQKIFVGNCGHAITAYLGHLKGATKLSEATANDRIVNISALASLEAGIGLCLEFDMPMDEMIETVKSRRTTRRNVGVDDTIARVGREPLRKLSDNERFMGGAKLALKHGFVPLNLCLSAAAAMHFELPDDPESVQLQNMIKVPVDQRKSFAKCAIWKKTVSSGISYLTFIIYWETRLFSRSQVTKTGESLQISPVLICVLYK
jgi:mannitol-1-phosphate 5-dehydrogenase